MCLSLLFEKSCLFVYYQCAHISFKIHVLKIGFLFSLREMKYMGQRSRFVCFLSRSCELRFNLNIFWMVKCFLSVELST